MDLKTTYYTIREATEILKVTRMSIYRYIKSGKLEATKTKSGQVLIPEESLRNFMGLN